MLNNPRSNCRTPKFLHRSAGALLVSALLGLLVTVPTSNPATAAETPKISGLNQTPWVKETDAWSLTLSAEHLPPGSKVKATLYNAVRSIDEYHRALFGDLDRSRLLEIDGPTLNPAGTSSVTETINLVINLDRNAPESRLPGWGTLRRKLKPGVYPVEVEIENSDGNPISRLVVPLNRVAEDETPVPLAPILGLNAPLSTSPTDQKTDDSAVVEKIQAALELRNAHPELAFTLRPQPELIESAQRTDKATELVEQLNTELGRTQVISSPYVNIDTASMVTNGLVNEVTRQRRRGTDIGHDAFKDLDPTTWWLDAPITDQTIEVLNGLEISTFVVPSASMTAQTDPNASPYNLRAGRADVDVVVTNDTLSHALTRRGDPVLDMADLAAEIVLATLADTTTGLAISLPNNWSTDQGLVEEFAAAIGDPDSPVQATTIAGLLQSSPPTTSAQLAPTLVNELGDWPPALIVARERLNSFSSFAGEADDDRRALDQRLLLSADRNLTPERRQIFLDLVTEGIQARFNQIKVQSDQSVTLTANDGDIPLSLANEDERPARVLLEIRTDERIEVDDGPRQIFELQPGANSLNFGINTRAPGQSTVKIQLWTPDHQVKLGETSYTVRSSGRSGVGVVLSVGAVAFLLLWWLRDWRNHGDAPAA